MLHFDEAVTFRLLSVFSAHDFDAKDLAFEVTLFEELVDLFFGCVEVQIFDEDCSLSLFLHLFGLLVFTL